MGVAGSGKTTIGRALAERLGWLFEDGDAFHSAANVEKMRSGQPLTDEDRWPWLRAIAAELDHRRAAKEPVVIACSALKRSYRAILLDGRTDARLVYLRGRSQLILSRLQARRGHYMPPALLDSQFRTLEEPGEAEHPLTVDVDGPVDAIVDTITAGLTAARVP